MDSHYVNESGFEESSTPPDMYAKVDLTKKQLRRNSEVLNPEPQLTEVPPRPSSRSTETEDRHTQKIVAKFNDFFATGLAQDEFRVSQC